MYIKVILILISILTLVLSGCTAPTPTIEGKYYSEVDPSAYLELLKSNLSAVSIR